ncbi:MAG: hypothetical protein A3G18_03435 [Rhodospirillales bacterium RIFCSPLOWO2_12_FULL_58_28]|nr:MAG: hypothetical protein A3H92_03380 [Rhodospirillales bacterium RIFCSPLOWO2_02_FULL_58_16]OHC77328.1 MAG: hypothetical protein A3G18_03435 [Rhodospirillales bacterium RIFCSPLOWO2_12_FULL_58_28]
MAGFIDILIAHHQKNKVRARKLPILKASMAAAAIVAVADGEASRRESLRVQRLIKILDTLSIYNTDHAAEIFSDYVSKLRDDHEAGPAEAMEAIEAVKGDPEEAAMVVMICKTISEADGVVDEAEATSINRICSLLDIDPDAIKSVAVRGTD